MKFIPISHEDFWRNIPIGIVHILVEDKYTRDISFAELLVEDINKQLTTRFFKTGEEFYPEDYSDMVIVSRE
jgi:hypothetical protein